MHSVVLLIMERGFLRLNLVLMIHFKENETWKKTDKGMSTTPCEW